jgi:nucleoside-diphosphate-sugar epimerase
LKVFEGVDCVCHVAGLAHVFDSSQFPLDAFHKINVVGAENVAYAAICAGVKHFVLISSVSVYGGVAHGKDESSGCHPEGPYAESKLQAEQRLINMCQSKKIDLTILRLATLYGEEDPGNLRRLIESIARGRFIWIGKGENLKSLLYREDAAGACIRVLLSPPSGIHIYNVSAPARKMYDVVHAISSALGKPIPEWKLPASFALASIKIAKILSFNSANMNAISKTVQKWLADDYYNTDKFNREYNFQVEVGLEEGIRREVDWYKSNLMNK